MANRLRQIRIDGYERRHENPTEWAKIIGLKKRLRNEMKKDDSSPKKKKKKHR